VRSGGGKIFILNLKSFFDLCLSVFIWLNDMIIQVKTVGTLKTLEEGPKVVSLEIPEGASVSQAIERMGLKDWEVGLVLINGTHGTKESILKDQDQLTLIAPLAGG
jgi:sulfur carrier protein ThiS